MTVTLLALLVAAVWGIAPIFEKLSLARVSPFTALTIRFMFTTGIVVVISLVSGRFKDIKNVDPMSLLWICLGGIIGGVIGLLLYFVALKQGMVTRVIPITATFPLFTAFYAYLFLHEQLTAIRVAGILLVVLGVVLINWRTIA